MRVELFIVRSSRSFLMEALSGNHLWLKHEKSKDGYINFGEHSSLKPRSSKDDAILVENAIARVAPPGAVALIRVSVRPVPDFTIREFELQFVISFLPTSTVRQPFITGALLTG